MKHIKPLFLLAIATLGLGACDQAAPTAAPTVPATAETIPTRTIRLSVADLGKRPVSPNAKVRLVGGREVEVEAGGHRVRFSGNSVIVDGRYQAKLSPELAAFIEQGRMSMEYRESPEGKRLRAVAERAVAKRTERLGRVGRLAAVGDPCIDLGNALFDISQTIDNFWENAMMSIAFDIAKDLIASTLLGVPEIGVAVLIADVGTYAVELEFLKIQRDGIAGDMRAANCL